MTELHGWLTRAIQTYGGDPGEDDETGRRNQLSLLPQAGAAFSYWRARHALESIAAKYETKEHVRAARVAEAKRVLEWSWREETLAGLIEASHPAVQRELRKKAEAYVTAQEASEKEQ